VVAGSLVAASLLAGMVGTGLGFVRSTRANERLSVALVQVREQESAASRSALRLAAVHGFFLDRMLGANDPDISGGEDVRVRKVLDDAVAEVSHVTEPDLEGALRHEIGSVYLALGMWKEAVGQLDRAITIRDGTPSASRADRADTLVLLSRATQSLDDSARAETLARRARALRVEEFGEGSDPSRRRTSISLAPCTGSER
jgi:hypothetical protein